MYKRQKEGYSNYRWEDVAASYLASQPALQQQLEEKKKAGITAAPSVFKPLPPRLPALMFAEAVWKQINKKGLPYQGIVDKIAVDGVAKDLTDEQLGKQLFELTCAAQSRGLDPEGALRRYADRVTYAVEKKMSS